MFDNGGSPAVGNSERKPLTKIDDEVDVATFNPIFDVLEKPQVIIHPHDSAYIGSLLKEIRPKYIIVYDPDISVIRQVEIFRASNPRLALQVYFMLYDGSVEEQKYLSSVNSETGAFQTLIREKAVSRFGFVVGLISFLTLDHPAVSA